jgi:leucyl/phenylalanyl-tRNA--protein transferase
LEFDLIDCQITTAHLIRFGAREISRARFLDELKKALKSATLKGNWSFSAQPAGNPFLL